MSVQTRTQTRCKYCSQTYRNGFDGQYCSKLCFHKQQGERLLNCLRHDHTICPNCSAKLKDIEEPTDEQLRQINGMHSANSVVGYQYPRPEAEIGEKDIVSDAGERVITGIVCGECGNASTNTEFPEWQERHLLEYGHGIFETLREKEDEHNASLDRDVFFEMLLATEDLVFALGKARDG